MGYQSFQEHEQEPTQVRGHLGESLFKTLQRMVSEYEGLGYHSIHPSTLPLSTHCPPSTLLNYRTRDTTRCAKRRRDTTQSRTAANCTSLQLLKIGLCLFLSSYNRTDQQHERVQEGGGEWGRKGGGEADLPFPANTPHVITTAGNCGRWAGGARADVVHNMWRYKTGGLL